MKKLVMVLVLLVIVLIIILSFVECDPLIDPSISFGSLEEVQDSLSNDFYYFEFDSEQILLNSYLVITNTQSYRRHQSGDFENIGYNLGYSMYPITGNYHTSYFSASAILGETLDGLVDHIRKWIQL